MEDDGSEGEEPEVVELFQFGTSAEVGQKAETKVRRVVISQPKLLL